MINFIPAVTELACFPRHREGGVCWKPLRSGGRADPSRAETPNTPQAGSKRFRARTLQRTKAAGLLCPQAGWNRVF